MRRAAQRATSQVPCRNLLGPLCGRASAPVEKESPPAQASLEVGRSGESDSTGEPTNPRFDAHGSRRACRRFSRDGTLALRGARARPVVQRRALVAHAGRTADAYGAALEGADG